MRRGPPPFRPRLAASAADVAAAQALRYRVFVGEMGARGAFADHARGIEADRFDPHCEHLVLPDPEGSGAVVGTYRLLTEAGAARAGGFATEAEFDVAPLRASGRRLLELGRACLDPKHRGGAAMLALWQALAGLVRERGIEVLFGLASFPGPDLGAHREALSHLHHAHLAPAALRPRSLDPAAFAPLPPQAVDRRRAVLALPPLVKAYLRHGGQVGEGAWVDRTFGCVDVCMVLDVATRSSRAEAGGAGEGA